jgi:hypothetical protein
MFEKCGDEMIACHSNHDCVLLAECFRLCNANLSCAEGCQAKYPGAVDLITRQLDCTRARCPACQ